MVSSDVYQYYHLHESESTGFTNSDFDVTENIENSSVGSEPKLGSAWFWLELLRKKSQQRSACHAFQKARLGSPYLAKKSSVELGLLYHLKNRVTLKNKK